MDKGERDQRLAEATAAQEARIEGHVRALELLEATTPFDLDIASTIHPDIIDVRTEHGRDLAALYQQLYEATTNNVTYITMLRYNMGLKPGCHGFGQPADYEAKNVWVRVFKNLPTEAITYSANDSGAIVGIDHPSVVFARTEKSRGMGSSHDDRTILFDQEPLRLFSEGLREQQLVPRLIAHEEPEAAYRLLFDAREIESRSPGVMLGLVDRIRKWSQKEKLDQPE